MTGVFPGDSSVDSNYRTRSWGKGRTGEFVDEGIKFEEDEVGAPVEFKGRHVISPNVFTDYRFKTRHL